MKGKLLYAEYEHEWIGKTYEDLLDKNINHATVKITEYIEDHRKDKRFFRGEVYRCGKLQSSGIMIYADFVEQRIEQGTLKLIE